MAKAAENLGLHAEAEQYVALAEEQKNFLLDEYFTPHGHLSVATQAAYVVAVQFDVYRDIEVIARDFVA